MQINQFYWQKVSELSIKNPTYFKVGFFTVFGFFEII